MQDKVVMGDQNYGLRGLTRFSDNEGDIIWPAWRAELMQFVKFEIGTIGNKIIEGEFKEEDVDQGEVAGDISLLVNALIPKTRAEVQTRSDWMERVEVEDDSSSSSSDGDDEDGGTKTITRITLMGKMSLQSAITKIKRSYFEAIQTYGLVKSSATAKNFAKLKLNYANSTLPQRLHKVDHLFCVTDSELKDAYIEQMAGLRVLGASESAGVLRNLLGECEDGDAKDDVCRGFECFSDMKHTINQLAEGIQDCADKIRTLLGELEPEPECMQAKIIVPKIVKSIKFVDQYQRPIESYRDSVGTDETKHDLEQFFSMLHKHETEYRRFKKRREGSSAKSTASAPVLLSKPSQEAEEIPTCRLHGTDGGCSHGDECIYSHLGGEGKLLNDPVARTSSTSCGRK